MSVRVPRGNRQHVLLGRVDVLFVEELISRERQTLGNHGAVQGPRLATAEEVPP